MAGAAAAGGGGDLNLRPKEERRGVVEVAVEEIGDEGCGVEPSKLDLKDEECCLSILGHTS